MKFKLTSISLLIASLCNAQTITSTEAVEYDEMNNRFFISNGTSILVQDSGSDDLAYFGDSEADFGMEIIGNTLITISGGATQSIKFHDLTTEEELNSISIPGSSFLNGMASDPEGNRIWITDFSTNEIIQIDVEDITDPVVQTVVSNTGCTPNGITYDADNNRLVFVCWTGGDINAVDLTDYSISTLTDANLNNMDGIDNDGEGNFYVSSWSPTRISKFNNDFTEVETVTSSGLANPADISYAVAIDTLAISNSGNNSITYISFGSTENVESLAAEEVELSIFPNPVTENSHIEFTLSNSENCIVTLYDAQGKVVYELMNEKLLAGKHKLLLAGYALSSGKYICELKTETASSNIQLIVN